MKVKRSKQHTSARIRLAETDIAITQHRLQTDWFAGVTDEVAQIEGADAVAEREGRVDLTSLPMVTIDGADAKDFDDAVFAEANSDGWTLWVGIADVSHYVPVGSSLDHAAYERGTSVYFPDRVLPMLPEMLSNDLCSLLPQKNRLSLVVVIDVSHQGKINDWQFQRALIRSHYRLNYEEVKNHLTSCGGSASQAWPATIARAVDDLADVAATLRAFRSRQGTVEFDLPETVVGLSPAGKVRAISRRRGNLATKLVEECMLAANVCAGLSLNVLPQAIYRTHEPPLPGDVNALRDVLSAVGLKLSGRRRPSVADFQDLLAKAKLKTGQEKWVQLLLLRSFQQARYVSTAGGHFALGFSLYTHFTSPIRRYPDLIVHRLLKGIYKWPKGHLYDEAGLLDKIASHSSLAERQAESAVREVTARLKAGYMRDRIGQVFSGAITGVTEFGVFVELDEMPVDGLIHVSQLGNDYFLFEPEKMQLIGERTARQIRLGDAVEVIVAGVDVDSGRINFVPNVEGKSQRSRSAKRRKWSVVG